MPDGRPSGSRAAMGNVIELRALRALALAAGGEHTAAVAALAEALTLAHPQGHLRVVADEGPDDRPTRPAHRDPTRADPRRDAWCGRAADRREMQVLTLLAVGRSNGRIAAELYVTIDTVKKHVGHILDKLGAANRTRPPPGPGNSA